ncbi:MAG TPA: glycerophosphodiester phosphodiesterase family protein, partial [Bacteroidota bacterium]|nr:glycerophosphodiester phosphodiesterase family protein [Bacteroidota bacterium]
MNFWLATNRLPLIIAHRGSSAVAPENTLAAFKQAIRDRADAVELDIQLTSDGEVVVFHDRRLERTTDGKGLLQNHSLQELRALSAGAWFSPGFSSETIPTLQEVFDLIQGTIGINIEIKAERGFHSSYDLADRCCHLITANNLQHRVLVSSFSGSVIKRVKECKTS